MEDDKNMLQHGIVEYVLEFLKQLKRYNLNKHKELSSVLRNTSCAA